MIIFIWVYTKQCHTLRSLVDENYFINRNRKVIRLEKHIFIYSYAQLNLGDDLFIKILCNRYPETKFYIICNKKSSVPFKKIPNLKVIFSIPLIDGILRRLNLKLRINNLLEMFISSRCDAIVNIGGSIFMEGENWQDSVYQYEKRIIRDLPFYIIGSNFGPYKDDKYYQKYKFLFKNVTDVCFRDKYSYELFSDLANVRQAADVVFSYTLSAIKNERKQIVISVIDLLNRGSLKKFSEVYTNKIMELSRYFIQQGYYVYLMGFCKIEGDNRSILQIISSLNDEEKKYIKTYFYSGDIDDALMLIEESKFVIASRFHAMILSWVFQKPVYPIVYSDKSLHVMQDIRFDGLYTEIENINEINVAEVYDYLSHSKPLNIERQTSSANIQFKKLDEFLL
jgi:colanic acid/amylovoran biosynthesis protein